jgi:hypothetical protein
MDKYYYLIAQLPFLHFAGETYIDIDSFLEEAEKWMSESDYTTLQLIDIHHTHILKSDPPAHKEYKRFENALRSELAEFRKAKQEGHGYKPTLFSDTLVKENNPLEAEKELMKIRWNYIEELKTRHHFDLEYLVLYYLELQILARIEAFDKEKGMEKFKQYTEVEL